MGHRKMASPDSVIVARIHKNLARCDNCGHFLWRIAGDHLESSIDEGIAGWRFFEDDVWRPTTEHRTQRKRAEAQLHDSTLSPAERKEIRYRLRWNRFRRGESHTGVPASRSALEQVSVARNTANKVILDLARLGVLPSAGHSADEDTVMVIAGPKSGVYERKRTRDASELSQRLVDALQLPAKLECPQCEAVNHVTRS
jgi:hypothetical protein